MVSGRRGAAAITMFRELDSGYGLLYRVTIRDDGRVTYSKEAMAREIGRPRVAPTQLARLLAAFEACGFAELPGYYHAWATCHGRSGFAVRLVGTRRARAISWDHSNPSVPRELRRLRRRIERLLWVGGHPWDAGG